jgi:NTP pyrophosphatase (non-canonical NTP hydrolase)
MNDSDTKFIRAGLNVAVKNIHDANVAAGWWSDLTTGKRKDRNKGELLMLMVSELAEAMEGERKNLMDDKLPHRPMAEVELADTFIRICDYCGAFGYDLAGAVIEKLAFNASREDHKIANRKLENGKKF